MTNPWTDFLTDHWLSITLLIWMAIVIRPTTNQCRCDCRCSTTPRPNRDAQ